MRAWRPAMIAAAALALAVTLSGPASAAVDPAIAALERDGVYVQPRVFAPVAPLAENQLREARARLADEDKDVKLAIVLGPRGSPTLRAYAQRLRREIDYHGTLVITAPGSGVVATGPLAPATITRRLRAIKAARIGNPADRAIAAAEVAAPVDSGDGWVGIRQISILLLLAVLGGAWAVAWGLRRESRRRNRELAEARAAMRVYLDALGARAALLEGHRARLSDQARERVGEARAVHREALAALDGAARPEQIKALAAPTRAAFAALAEAAAELGEELPAEDPFAGLCGVDPAHGRATAEAPTADRDDSIPVCARCYAAAQRGTPEARRLVWIDGRPAPFDEAGAVLLGGEPPPAG